MTLALQIHATPGDFLKEAGPFLLREEAENNLILGTVGDWVEAPYPKDPSPILVSVVQNNETLAAGFCSLKGVLILSRAPVSALSCLAAHRWEGSPVPGGLAGVVAPMETARQFARAWSREKSCNSRTARRMLVYQLDRVSGGIEAGEGRLRPVHPSESELAAGWIKAFGEEVGETMDGPAMADRMVSRRALFFWDRQGPVTLIGWSGRTAHGVRINLVYTPPEQRGHGFATAGVAALSGNLLDEGNRFCFLFTDLENPTANKIYRRIGFRPLQEIHDIRFIGG